MLQLHFGRTASLSPATAGPSFGPATAFRFEGNRLYGAERTGESLARLESSAWHTAGIGCDAFHFIGAARIHFENARGECSRRLGPFADITGAEGCIRVASGRLFASYLERKQAWHAFALGSDWPVMVLTALPVEPRAVFDRRGLITALR